MSEFLLEAFRHHAWATRQLLVSCRGLSEEQLRAPGSGTYGSILETLNKRSITGMPTGSRSQPC